MGLCTGKLQSIHLYPLKSGYRINLEVSEINPRGLYLDRHWALFDEHQQVVTARKFPAVLDFQPKLGNNRLTIYNRVTGHSLDITNLNDSRLTEEAWIFNNKVAGVGYGHKVDAWFSNYLGIQCRLLYMNSGIQRQVKEKHGGKKEDMVSYADQCPILLIGSASVDKLNEKLAEPVTVHHFRPNLVVQTDVPNIEDNWKWVSIGNCSFEVVQTCIRCIFTTIDPETKKRNDQQEPLRTLSTYRKLDPRGISFGVHLIPRKTGTINLQDSVEVVESQNDASNKIE